MSLEQAGSMLQNLATALQGIRNELLEFVIIPLAEQTLNQLNMISGIHLGDTAISLGQFTLSPEQHKVVDICDELTFSNIGYGPGVFPLDYFSAQSKDYNGGLAHNNCHCTLEPLTGQEQKDAMADAQWKLEITPSGVVFINESEKVNRQIQGWGDQISEGKVTSIGAPPDDAAEKIIIAFEEALPKQVEVYISKRMGEIMK